MDHIWILFLARSAKKIGMVQVLKHPGHPNVELKEIFCFTKAFWAK